MSFIINLLVVLFVLSEMLGSVCVVLVSLGLGEWDLFGELLQVFIHGGWGCRDLGSKCEQSGNCFYIKEQNKDAPETMK